MRNEAYFLTLHFCCAGAGRGRELSRDNLIFSEIAQNVPFGWDFQQNSQASEIFVLSASSKRPA